MRVLVCPQEFKGSMTAAEAAAALAAGVRDAVSDADVETLPLSDGGPGLVDAMLAARGGERRTAHVRDPLMRPISAAWGLLPDGVAVIEMAAASGLLLLAKQERDPGIATTYGTGMLIAAALDAGCTTLIIGAGGSATVDGGAGVMQALGARLLDASGADLPAGGAALARLARIDRSGVDPRLAGARIRVATDITATLLGPAGAALMYGPQKGATPALARELESALAHFADIALRDTNVDLRSVPGGGAAGGLGCGLMLIAPAMLERGFTIVAEAVGLAQQIEAADVVITGEGRLDAQTGYGKTADGVARMAHAQARRVAIVAGIIDPAFDPRTGAFDDCEQAAPPAMPADDAIRQAPALARSAATRLLRRMMDAGR